MSVMAAREDTPVVAGDGAGVSALDAMGGLREVEAARVRAGLRARLFPWWYGPVLALVVAVPGVVQSWSVGRRGYPVLVSLLVWCVGMALLLVMRQFGARSTGVVVSESLSDRLRRNRLWLLAAFVGCGATWGVGLLLGAGESALRLAASVVAGLFIWGLFAWRNATVRRELSQLRDAPGAA
ncbi:hypothetical protein [Streptomyces sp. NPDC059080]|uniref:hypothetical protein n=1 Tax=Streptomyces sp. NPDC059080 TaxID=3346718 RepID=UPI00367593BF